MESSFRVGKKLVIRSRKEPGAQQSVFTQEHSGNETQERGGRAKIHGAASRNELKVVQAQINNDPLSLDAEATFGETPLMIAALRGSFEVTGWLIKKGANLHHKLSNGNTVVHCAAASNCSKTLMSVLNQKDVVRHTNSKNKMGDTPAHMAVRCGSPECVRVLCDHGVDLNIINQYSQSPMDLACSLGNTECLQILQSCSQPPPLPVVTNTAEDSDLESIHDVAVPGASLQNDLKHEFHDGCEPAILAQGNNVSSQTNSSGNEARGNPPPERKGKERPHPQHSSAHSTTSEDKYPTDQRGGAEGVSLAPLEPMRQKMKGKRDTATQQGVLCDRQSSDQEKAVTKTPQKKGKTISNGSCGVHQQKGPAALPPNICPNCLTEKTARAITIDRPRGIVLGQTTIDEAESLKYDETTCFECSLKARQVADTNTPNTDCRRPIENEEAGKDSTSVSKKPDRRISNTRTEATVTEARRPSSTVRDSESSRSGRERRGSAGRPETRESDWMSRKATSRRNPSSVVGGDECEGEISDDELVFRDNSIKRNQESGHLTLPQTDSCQLQEWIKHAERTESPSLVEIQEHKTPVADRMEVRCGEEVSFYAKATPKGSSPLKYRWYEVKRGNSYNEIGKSPTLRFRATKTMKVFCRVSVQNITVDSKQVTIIPELVWITSQLTQTGHYYGKRVDIKCTAEKYSSVVGKMSYEWLKKGLAHSRFEHYRATESGILTFDPFSPEDNGHYVCQAEVMSYFTETNELLVEGMIEPMLEVIKQPRSRVVNEGGTLELQCQARLRDGSSGSESICYQWFHENNLIPKETSPIYKRSMVKADDEGMYRCSVSSRKGGPVFTEPATVALALLEETDAALNPRQMDQLKAEQILQTIHGTRYASDKVAIVVGNEAYHHHRQLSICAADVRILQEALTEAGFKVFSLVNLSCRETMSMLKLVSDMLVAGAYVVFAYTGHGCNVGNTDYIVPVDAHDPVNPNECVASSTISEYLQSKLCRVFMIMNCCRTKPKASFPVPQHQRSCNYANYATLTASTEGNKAYEERSFTKALAESIREGGSYKKVFDTVLEKMKKNCVSDGVDMFARPTVHYSTMDPEITFQDQIMLGDETLEPFMDQMLEIWRKVNTPPDSIALLPKQVGPLLSNLIEDIRLNFECEFTNVLVVYIKWRVNQMQVAAISCTLEQQGQGVDIERSSMTDYEASFRVSSLQRLLPGTLQLHFTFSIRYPTYDEPHTFSVIHDLKLRPLYAQMSLP